MKITKMITGAVLAVMLGSPIALAHAPEYELTTDNSWTTPEIVATAMSDKFLGHEKQFISDFVIQADIPNDLSNRMVAIVVDKEWYEVYSVMKQAAKDNIAAGSTASDYAVDVTVTALEMSGDLEVARAYGKIAEIVYTLVQLEGSESQH